MSTSLTIYHDRPAAFWTMLGPFFARREHRRVLPYLVDDDGYSWFLDVAEDGTLRAFASAHIDTKGVGHLHGLYVLPTYRNEDRAKQLIAARLDYLQSRGVCIFRTTANAQSVPLLTAAGFVAQQERGQYTDMVLSGRRE